MKAKEIKDLIDFISNTGLEEVNIETEEFKINIKRSHEAQNIVSSPIPAVVPVSSTAPQVAEQPKQSESSNESSSSPAAESGNYVEVKSPMIGTFYRSPNPDSPSFVNVGDKINKGDTVCIVEAMKLFNEIESEVSGTIVKILVENASPVEYDQPLFLVDPS